MSTHTHCLVEAVLVRTRVLNSLKLEVFTHNATLNRRVLAQLGWSQHLADVVLNAYNEFIELKIIGRDWDTSNVIPSWCVRQVWKLHALGDKKEYEDGCERVCNRLIRYQIEVKDDPDGDHNNRLIQEQYTQQMYLLRFNHSMHGSVWDFNFDPLWKTEYQKHDTFYNNGKNKSQKTSKVKKNMKVKKKVANTKLDENTSNTTTSEVKTPDVNTTESDKNSESSNTNNNLAVINDSNIPGPSRQVETTNSNLPLQLASNDTGTENGNSAPSNILSNASTNKRRRSKNAVVNKDPVITRSLAKRMRLTL